MSKDDRFFFPSVQKWRLGRQWERAEGTSGMEEVTLYVRGPDYLFFAALGFGPSSLCCGSDDAACAVLCTFSAQTTFIGATCTSCDGSPSSPVDSISFTW